MKIINHTKVPTNILNNMYMKSIKSSISSNENIETIAYNSDNKIRIYTDMQILILDADMLNHDEIESIGCIAIKHNKVFFHGMILTHKNN